ncbi:MAG: pyridoxamine 5'-phosphate oxidase [Gemmataceae bacterium]|nr:pyridoxamine 5'-phosphate oxidase [Gemmataceae bacterium]
MSQEFPSLDEASAGPDPFALFARWLEQAQNAGMVEPFAMTLATATLDGAPSARIVLLRGYDTQGFVFYTNYRSRKAEEMAANPRAALVFHWPELDRQVRIEGVVNKVSTQESDAYFQTRPRGHQLAAAAAVQSAPLESRQALVEAMAQLEVQYQGVAVPRPEHWGGYRLTPSVIEFWQSQPNRLHDRLLYQLQSDGVWQLQRLAP